MFTDDVIIEVAAGDGGNGLASFLRQKYKPRGGPDGGDGGNGGDIVIVADPKLQSLQQYANKRKFAAQTGKPGMKFNRSGRSGEVLEIPVPLGSEVRDADGHLLADLFEGDRVIVARGGRGGRGNQHFASSRNQAPVRSDLGGPGELRRVRLSYFISADVAFVGLANTGKSALAAALADTDFTPPEHAFSTRVPAPLSCRLAEWLPAVLLDLPSVHPPAGGDPDKRNRFLRQLKRVKVVVFTLDAASEIPPEEQLEVIEKALAEWETGVANKKTLVALTRTDLAAETGGEVRKVPRGSTCVSIKDPASVERLRETIAGLMEG